MWHDNPNCIMGNFKKLLVKYCLEETPGDSGSLKNHPLRHAYTKLLPSWCWCLQCPYFPATMMETLIQDAEKCAKEGYKAFIRAATIHNTSSHLNCRRIISWWTDMNMLQIEVSKKGSIKHIVSKCPKLSYVDW